MRIGITEFARAWYTKNPLKNAARHGARITVVLPSSNPTFPVSGQCSGSPCPTAGDTILVSVSAKFNFITGNSPWPWSKSQTFIAEASMRYE